MVRNRTKLHMTIILCMACLIIGNLVFTTKTDAKSEMPYYIKVNKQQNCVTVYEKDKKGQYTVPVKSMVCSVGYDTPTGSFKTPVKYRWKLLMNDVWGQYSTRIVGGILFHSVWYYEMDASTLSAAQYNRLGSTASHGCVRLTVADAKWIYDNCPIGTTVEIYNSKDPGPLGKPEAAKLTIDTKWDPTDPSNSNPFHKIVPSITGIANKSIEWGTKVDLVKGVKALSTTGTDITKNLVVKGEINSYKAGVYKVEYSITDILGKTSKKTMSITIKKPTQPPVIKGVTDKVVGKNTKVDRAFALKGVSAYLSTLKLSAKDIKVSIIKTKEDLYTINYSIKADNNKIGKMSSLVHIDSTAPSITGIYYKELTKEQFNAGKTAIEKLALKNIIVSDDYSKLTTKNVKVVAKQINDYTYEVAYNLKDEVGNTFTETAQYTYFSDVRIEGVQNVYDIPYGTEINEEFVKYGVTAANKENEDCSDKIAVDIQTKDKKTYTVTYSVENTDGSVVSLTCIFVMEEKPEGYVESIVDKTNGLDQNKTTENTNDINSDIIN